LTSEEKRVVDFHDLQITDFEGELKASFDVTVDHSADEKEDEALKQRLTAALEEELGGVRVVIRVESQYV